MKSHDADGLSGKLLKVTGTHPRDCQVEREKRPEKKTGLFRKPRSLSSPFTLPGQGWGHNHLLRTKEVRWS